jgi:hypothetical protein
MGIADVGIAMTTMLVSFLGELSQDYFCGQIILLPGIK